MANKIVFNDTNDNEMEVFLTIESNVFIGLKAEWSDSYIELNKDDVIKLIEVLSNFVKYI